MTIEAQIDRYRRDAMRVARTILGPDDAEDAVQDACVRAYQYRTSFDPLRGDFWHWFSRIVTRAAFVVLRRVSADAEVLSLDEPIRNNNHGGELPTRGDVIPASEPSLDEHVLRELAKSTAHKAVHAALRKIDPQDRDLIRLVYLEGADREVVAQDLSISMEALRMRLSRATALLEPHLMDSLAK